MASTPVQQRNALPMPASPQVRPASEGSAAPKREAPRTDGKSFADELGGNGASQARDAAPRKDSAPVAKDAPKDAPKDAGQTQAKAPDGKAAAAKKALAPLKQAASANKQAIDESPVVAFLTGRLDRLSPAEIPSLITGNEFLAGALTDGDLAGFLGQETDVESLLDALELPHALTREAEMAGLDPNATLAASDILRAIGVDPQRVLVELTHLKDNLRMDGLQPYMARAALLGAPKGKLKDQVFAEQDAGARAAMPAVPVTGAAGTAKVSGPSLPGFGLDQPGQSAGAPRPGESAALAMPAFLAPLASPLAAAQAPLSSPSPQGARPAVVPSLAMTEAPSLESLTLPSELPLGAAATAVPEAIISAGTASLTAPPAMRAATHDPVRALEQQLVKGESIRIDEVAPQAVPVPRETISDALLRERFVGAQLLAAPSLPNVPQPQAPVVQAPVLANVLAQPAQQPRDFVQAPAKEVSVNPFMLDALQSGAPKMDRPLVTGSGAVPLEDLRLTLPTATLVESLGGERSDKGDAGARGGGEQSQGRDFGGGAESGLSLTAPELPRAAGLKTPDAPQFKLDAPTSELAMSPQQRAEFVKQVYDRAVSVVREGGGSVRLDLGTPELGKLEMAVSVQEGRVDLKILTGSDRMRDALAGEMSRLRDSLATQNLTLGRVDVGLDTRAQQQHGGFNFNGGQQQAFERQQHMTEMRDMLTTRLRDAATPPRDVREVASLAALRRPAISSASTLAVRV